MDDFILFLVHTPQLVNQVGGEDEVEDMFEGLIMFHVSPQVFFVPA